MPFITNIKILKYITHVLLFIILIQSCTLKKEESCIVDLYQDKETFKYQLVIPVEIEDSIIYFLWDTGSEDSFIDYHLVSELGLQKQNRPVIKTFIRSYDEVTDTFFHNNIKLKIGDFTINPGLYLDDTEFTSKSRVGITPPIKGLLGQDIISQFQWLFDFEKSKVIISKEQIHMDDYDKSKELVLPFRYLSDSKKIPIIDLNLDTIDSKEFYFDTGSRYSIVFFDKFYLYPILIMEEDITESIPCEHILKSGEEQNPGTIILYNNISLNNFDILNTALLNRNSYLKINFITVNFIFQFEKMYYNPEEKEINFIEYRQRNHPSGDESKFIYYLDDLEKN